MLTNRCFCPMPWTGLMYNFDGSVKNCIRSSAPIGNIKDSSIQEILAGPDNQSTQTQMLERLPGDRCYPCYDIERDKKSFDIISDRIFYIRELKHVPLETYEVGNHELHTIDVRWSNLCNFACTYCTPEFSSRWAQELKVTPTVPTEEQKNQFKEYIFGRAPFLKHVYMAGGEPLLMKENLELLEILEKTNPTVNLRINTNLSKVDSKVFEKICKFKNVHWTISVESIEEEFEYIRYGGSWKEFVENLDIVRKLEQHKVSFNMLHFLLNYHSIFDCIDYLKMQGFHNNSFIAGALLTPTFLNIRHLPVEIIQSVKDALTTRINEKPGYLLEDSYKNLLHYLDLPFEKTLKDSLERLQEMDKRRGINSQQVFADLYNLT